MDAKSEFPFEVRESAGQLGEALRLARVRRSLTQDELAQRCGITRKTLAEIEKGQPGVKFGSVLTMLWALGLLGSVKAVADPDADEHGRILEAARRRQRVRHVAGVEPDNDF